MVVVEKRFASFCLWRLVVEILTWLRVKNGYPKFNPGKWTYELKSAAP